MVGDHQVDKRFKQRELDSGAGKGILLDPLDSARWKMCQPKGTRQGIDGNGYNMF
jgi:hypothetical protein